MSQREPVAVVIVLVAVTTIAVAFIATIIRQLRPSPLTTTKSIVTFA